jgi:dUTP pyrophosphatase
VIDSGYRGEIKVPLYNNNPTHRYFPADDTMGGGGECYEENFDPIHVRKGDRVAQLLIVPIAQATLVQADTLDETERQDGSFGSSGVQSRRL